MGKTTKILTWVAVFAASAGAGAYVAAHTDQFPPGVADPGERPQPTETTPTAAPERRWQLHGVASTVHTLHVGGDCTSDWDVQALVRERSSGRVEGKGLATLRGVGGCAFPTATVQAETINLLVSGRAMQAGDLRLRFAVDGRLDPLGSSDLGGFVALLPGSAWSFTVPAASVEHVRGDGNEGTYRARWKVQTRCVSGC